MALLDNPSLIRSELATVTQAIREWAIDPEVEEQLVAEAWAIYRDRNTNGRTRVAAGKLILAAKAQNMKRAELMANASAPGQSAPINILTFEERREF